MEKDNSNENLDAPLNLAPFTEEDIAEDKIGDYGLPTNRLMDLPIAPKVEIANDVDALPLGDNFEKEPAVGGSYLEKLAALKNKS